MGQIPVVQEDIQERLDREAQRISAEREGNMEEAAKDLEAEETTDRSQSLLIIRAEQLDSLRKDHQERMRQLEAPLDPPFETYDPAIRRENLLTEARRRRSEILADAREATFRGRKRRPVVSIPRAERSGTPRVKKERLLSRNTRALTGPMLGLAIIKGRTIFSGARLERDPNLSAWEHYGLVLKKLDELAEEGTTLNFRNALLKGLIMPGANLTGVDFYQADLTEANLRGSNLSYAKMKGSFGLDADLEEATLWAVLAEKADYSGASFARADMRGANLVGAYLLGGNLEGTDLRSANMRSSKLRSANLKGANLQGTYLGSAEVDNASFTSANMMNADLRGVNLDDVLGGDAFKDVRFGNTVISPDTFQTIASSPVLKAALSGIFVEPEYRVLSRAVHTPEKSILRPYGKKISR